MHVTSLQSCPTLCNPMGCSPSDSSVHGILQARILEWVTMPSSRGSSWPRDLTCILCLLHWQAGSLPLAPTGKLLHSNQFSPVHSSLVAQSCLTLCIPKDYSTPCLRHSPNPGAFSSSCPSSLWCHQTISSSVVPFSYCLQSRVFSSESTLWIRWPRYWSFSLSISPSNEYSRLISFRIDWFDLFAGQGILKSLLQHHSSKASVLRHSAFFIIQLLHPYMTTGKTVTLALVIFWYYL